MSEPGTDLVLPSGQAMYREWFRDQFFNKAEIDSLQECWLWKGRSEHGYGYLIKQFVKPRRAISMRVHRLSYELAYGIHLNSNEYVHHRCGNRSCYNPTHLSLTDAHRHMADHHMLTHCKRGHEFTPDNTYYHKNGKRIQRICRKCELAKKRREHAIRYQDPEYRANKQARNREGYHRRRAKSA